MSATTPTLHCWHGWHEWVEETYGYLSDEWCEAQEMPGATCLLEHDHAGEHEWTPDDSIVVRFAGPSGGEVTE